MARVLILSDVFGTGGGAGAVAQTMAEALAKRHEVTVLTAEAPADLKPSNYQLNAHAIKIPSHQRLKLGVRNSAALAILQQHLREYKPDVAFVHNIHSAWSYASLSLLAQEGVRSVLTYHDVTAFTPYVKLCNIPYRRDGNSYTFDYHFSWWRQLRAAKFSYRPGRNAAVRRHLTKASARVAVSQALADALRANHVPVDSVIHNGREPIAAQLASDPSVFFGGRLSTSKGMLQVVDYLTALRDQHHLQPTVKIVGHPGSAADKLKAAAQSAGVVDQLLFLGWQPHATYQETIASCRVVLVPSICFDSLPTVILDAMACARPAVGSIFGGTRELIADGRTGYVVDPFAVPTVAQRLANLLTNADHAAALGTAGLQRLREEFSTQRMVQQYERLGGIYNY